jgi:hypothetical protein
VSPEEQAEIVANLHRLADAVGEEMTKFGGALVCITIVLSPNAEGGQLLRLVCGVQPAGDDDDL